MNTSSRKIIEGFLWAASLGCLLIPPVSAAVLLNANVIDMEGDLTIQRSGSSNRLIASIDDEVNHFDTLRTGSRSQADLKFNTRSLARMGAESSFYFSDDLTIDSIEHGCVGNDCDLELIRANIHLGEGVAVVFIPSGDAPWRMSTDEGSIQPSQQVDLRAQRGLVASTESKDQSTGQNKLFEEKETGSTGLLIGSAPLRLPVGFMVDESQTTQSDFFCFGACIVFNKDFTTSVNLVAGEWVSVSSNEIGEINTFDLSRYCSTSTLMSGICNLSDEDDNSYSDDLNELFFMAASVMENAVDFQENRTVFSPDPNSEPTTVKPIEERTTITPESPEPPEPSEPPEPPFCPYPPCRLE